MTRSSYSQRSAQTTTPAIDPNAALAKRVSGLRVACLAATIMILIQDSLGYWVAAAVEVPASDKGGDILTTIGRVLSSTPLAIAVHAGLGLILVITAISVVVRSILARRYMVLVMSVVGLAAILASNVTGARFVSTGEETETTVMTVASLVALVSYLACLMTLRPGRPDVR